MIKNKYKEIIKTHPFNTKKIKNLIHLNDLKKLKKYSITNHNNSNYITQQTKYIMRKLANKYNRNPEYYYRKIIADIIDNESSHLVASFKEYLIYGDYSEFLQGYFQMKDVIRFLPLIFDYYHSSTVIFPNYVALEEKKYIYKNIQKKQQIINIQQEQEEIDKKNELKKKEKEKKINNENEIINFESDSTSKSDILTPHVLNSILNQTNTSNNRKLFGINNFSNTSEDLHEFIEKMKNIEKKINLKNQNQKYRNKHMISIHKGNNIKKDNNKSNITNTFNTLSTKNNTKGKEKSNKSNIDAKSFSDKNIKNNYNLSSINLNYSKNINKHFLLKLGNIKRKNEMKTTKNILLEISSLNTSRKFKKINFFLKKNHLTEFNKSKGSKIEKIKNKNESIQNKNYNFKHIKRIKSYYGINQSISRNKNIFYENTIFSNNSNSSNKNISKNCHTTFRICSTVNNINKDKNKLSLDADKKNKKIIPKKNNDIKDSKIINVIYSNRLPLNYSTKNFLNNSKKLFKNKINKNKLKFPLENKINSKTKQKIQKSKFIYSRNESKLTNPIQIKISPPHTNRNENKKIIKFVLLSPANITSKFSETKMIQKKQINKNLQLNNKKLKIKKDNKKILNENKSNKIIHRKNIEKEGQLYTINDFLTINIDKKPNFSQNPIDMKKIIDNRNIIHSIKTKHYRTKTLYNKVSGNFIKYQK